MSWMFSIWAAGALLTVCRGDNSVPAGRSLSASGYHLCVENKTRTVTFLAVQKVPFSVTKPCGGWLLWKTCTVTEYRLSYQTEYKTVTEQETSCCHGYVQVGHYCAPSFNGSGGLSVKPGSCPATNGSHPGSRGCQWDMDCPGWLKCCRVANSSICSEPTRSTNDLEWGSNRFNATVVVKTDYQQLVSKDEGLLNHTRLLQSMVAGALQSNVAIGYMRSWPVHPYRTATALLIGCSLELSLHNITSKLHLLLQHIEEVLSVTVEDVDECAVPTLHHCPPSAGCNNTLGSYRCICLQGYVDADSSNPGVGCKAESTWAPTDLPISFSPTANTTNSSASNMTRAPTPTGALNDLTHVSTSSTPPSPTGSPLPTSTHCPAPPSVSSLWSANVTGSSFWVYWSSQAGAGLSYRVVVENGPEALRVWDTLETKIAVLELDPGVLYTVTVTAWGCGHQGHPLRLPVRTDAVTFDATARLTNIQFTTDLLDAGSQAYKYLTESIVAEIYKCLSPEIKALWDSGQVRVEIRGFSSGSVVANFTVISTPSQHSFLASETIGSLVTATKYTVDPHSIYVTDFNECSSGDNDCSQWATCTNTWGSYTCACLNGFQDHHPERAGRACQAGDPTSAPTHSPAWDGWGSTPATDVTTPASGSSAPPASSAVSMSATAVATSSAATAAGLKAAPSVPAGAISVQCRGATITVSVARDFLLRSSIRESSLYLGLLECGVNGGSSSHAQLTVGWTECDTRLVHNQSHYMASVTLFNAMNQEGVMETPKVHLAVPIVCAYEKSLLVSADLSSMGYDLLNDVILGWGSFLVRVKLMNGVVPLPHNYSLASGEVVVVDVSLNTSLEQIKVVINRCWATPTQNPGDTYSYMFMENSCSLNTYTKVLNNGNSSTSRVAVQIFSFVDLSIIYLHCQVHICAQIGSDSCVPDCLQRASRSSAKMLATALGSSGPLLRSTEENLGGDSNIVQIIGLSCLGVGLSLFFIITFLCLLYYQRNRIGHYNFNVNVKQENFTSLVSNTSEVPSRIGIGPVK